MQNRFVLAVVLMCSFTAGVAQAQKSSKGSAAKPSAPPLPPKVNEGTYDPAPALKATSETAWTAWQYGVFQISYPPKWAVVRDEAVGNLIGLFGMPMSSDLNDYQESVAVTHLTDFPFDGSTADLQQTCKTFATENLPDSKFVSSAVVKVGTADAVALTYSHTSNDKLILHRIVFFNSYNGIYSVGMQYAAAEKNVFEKLLSDMIATIKIL